MRNLDTEILIIGGGATGLGVLRDCALRGFKALLVEKGDLSTGTTGRYHGLLHSGGRYVVKDPQAARECIEENTILRRIMPHCIEDTGGFFVLTPGDDPAYAPRFVEGCRAAGIPCEEVPIAQMLKEEPLLNPQISACFRVPDASADSFASGEALAASVREYGGQALPYHKVTGLLLTAGRVQGAVCRDLAAGEDVTIRADMVVNASGAWAGQIAALAGLQVAVVPGKGTMLAANHRLVHTVINRLKMPADGDILVPAHTVAVIGTTDVRVEDPDHFAIEPWEVRLMLDEGEKIIPGFSQMRMVRAWAGVRPLYQETGVGDTRDITRAYVLLDHLQRDGLAGLVTITSGKWTTYRKMAEVTVDLVCTQLNTSRPCRTHLEPLPAPEHAAYHRLEHRLHEVEANKTYGKLVCECELATLEDIAGSLLRGDAKTLDDVRREVRLGMGPCQGGFCTLRVTGLLHRLRQLPAGEANAALRDFLQERWKGLLPILWGQQLRQERLNELIYRSLLNVPALPGPAATVLAAELYLPPQDAPAPAPDVVPAVQAAHTPARPAGIPGRQVVVIGAGLAGLSAAWQAAKAGRKVRLAAKGWGAEHWHAGAVDVLGELDGAPVDSPAAALEALARLNPQHPYARLGRAAIEEALLAFQALCAEAGYSLEGSLERNWLLPTAAGSARRTCLAPATMTAGDLRSDAPMLLLGFEQFLDFYPEWAAENLRSLGLEARGERLDLDVLAQRGFVTGVSLANLFQQAEFRKAVAEAARLVARESGAQRLGFPAVLGVDGAAQIHAELQERIGLPVFEIPGLPPSIPGMRLQHLLVRVIERLGGQVFNGMQVVAARLEGGRVRAVESEAAVRNLVHRGEAFILATGGVLGGGFAGEPGERLVERIFNLPLAPPAPASLAAAPPGWMGRSFLEPGGHPLYRQGLAVDAGFRPLDGAGRPVYENLYAAGGLLAGCDPLVERSLEGVALTTGYWAGKRLA
jgi:glycerol-3-phosphate dehydrogenase